MKEKSVIAGLGALVGRLIDEHRSMGDRCRELAAHCSEVEQENRMLRERPGSPTGSRRSAVRCPMPSSVST